MISRCENKNVANYHRYGGRGISVCDRWKNFENFYEDMGDPPDGSSIDRINNDGNYEPENCQWSSRHGQTRNKATNRLIEFGGEVMCLKDWASRLGMDQSSLSERIHKWGLEKALTTPKRK